MDKLVVWDYAIPCEWLTNAEADYLTTLPKSIPSVEWVWQETDRIWHHYKLDNKQELAGQEISNFYSHPVWLMNGIFTSVDTKSARHRFLIARYLDQANVKSIADYGGGFGELALGTRDSLASVDLVPSQFNTSRFSRLRVKHCG